MFLFTHRKHHPRIDLWIYASQVSKELLSCDILNFNTEKKKMSPSIMIQYVMPLRITWLYEQKFLLAFLFYTWCSKAELSCVKIIFTEKKGNHACREAII